MSRYLTEPEAWREIARRIAEETWKRRGLCDEAGALYLQWRIGREMMLAMYARLEVYLGKAIWAYPCGTQPEARILAALWLALEAEEETP